jgi:hypothetical protein
MLRTHCLYTVDVLYRDGLTRRIRIRIYFSTTCTVHIYDIYYIGNCWSIKTKWETFLQEDFL